MSPFVLRPVMKFAAAEGLLKQTLSAPTQEILLKYSLDLPYIQTGICFIEVFANTPYLQGVHHTHISGDHNDP